MKSNFLFNNPLQGFDISANFYFAGVNLELSGRTESVS